MNTGRLTKYTDYIIEKGWKYIENQKDYYYENSIYFTKGGDGRN